MGIEKIRSNFETNSTAQLLSGKNIKNRIFLGEIKDSTSFTGAGTVAKDSIKPLKEILLEIMPGSAKRMVKMHEGMGEIQNQLINAVGTGIIAPLFIKFNPISDTDEDTRTYTAWRQPISAVLAVGTQCAIVKPFNDIIRYMSDIGYLNQRYNASLFPSENYIKKQIKADNPNKHFTKDELKEKIKKYKDKNKQILSDMISDDKIVFKKTEIKGGKTVVSDLPMEDKDFKTLFNETLEKIIKEEKKERLNAIEHKLPKKIERGIFYHTNPEESRKVLQRISSKIKQTYNQSDFAADKIKTISSELNKEFKEIISELKSEIKTDPNKKDVNTVLINIVKELKNKNTDKDSSAIRILNNKINGMINTVDVVANKKTTQEIIEYVNQHIYERTNAIDELIDTLKSIQDRLLSSGISVKEAQKIINQKIEKSQTELYTKLQAKGLSEQEIKDSSEFAESLAARLKQKAGSLANCIGDQLEKHVKSNLDGYKRWTGLGVSLAILPVTCWLLNRIYPWFMDLAFPKLSNKTKGPKQDSATAVQNDKKAEVK